MIAKMTEEERSEVMRRFRCAQTCTPMLDYIDELLTQRVEQAVANERQLKR